MTEVNRYPVAMMCRALDVSRSGFYAWKTRPQSARSMENEILVAEMRAIHKQHRKSYGSPRMSDELVDRGKKCGRGRAERLMRENSIAAKPRKRFILTTQADPTKPVAPNLLDRNFSPQGPNQAWASDITYIRTLSGWLYLAVTLDLFSRKVVGWATSSKIDARLVVRALQMAIADRNPAPGLLHHSDQGSQYTADVFQEALSGKKMICSMSRRGNCWDNSVVESFFGSMKVEWLDDLYPNHREARRDMFEYIEVFYNRTRRHSTLSGLSPIQFETFHKVA
jgi:transposase InsO family protein